MRKLARKSLRALIDMGALAIALAVALLVRFDWQPPAWAFHRLVVMLPYVVSFQYGVLHLFRVPRFVWRYVGLREVTRMLFAVGTATAALLGIRLVLGLFVSDYRWLLPTLLPIGMILINGLLAFLAVAGVRVVRRITTEKATQASHRSSMRVTAAPTLLIGAGQAGLLVAKELEKRPDLGMAPVAFLDDDPFKHGTVVHGLPVLGGTSSLSDLVHHTGAVQALITISDAPGTSIRRIAEQCERSGISAKILPGLHEVVGGKVNLSRIRDIRIEDLLRRPPVELQQEAIADFVRDKVVMVTGAGGSIGSELCRQVLRFGPAKLVLVERAENNLFQVHRELLGRYPGISVVPCLADVRDRERMARIFESCSPHAVFHAAAHKHVPMVECNPGEALKNNVGGTRVLADLAHAHGVEGFVMVSTDKAVNPTSVMGASKRLAEMYVQALSQRSNTRFITVRFGNVLGSAGSVVPIFREQIAQGGPVTVTHPDMRRYFMTIPEACQLILQAATMGDGGEIFILDMGEPVRIVDLANDLIRLSGLRPGEDIEVRFTGIRPGEKLFEELLVDGEGVGKTKHPQILLGRLKSCRWEELTPNLERFVARADRLSLSGVAEQLRLLVPEYQGTVHQRQTEPPPARREAEHPAALLSTALRPPT